MAGEAEPPGIDTPLPKETLSSKNGTLIRGRWADVKPWAGGVRL